MSDPTPEPGGVHELVDTGELYANTYKSGDTQKVAQVEKISGPEPTEERRPTNDSWRRLAMEAIDLDNGDTWIVAPDAILGSLKSRRDALLAAEPEHLPSTNEIKAAWDAIPRGEDVEIIVDGEPCLMRVCPRCDGDGLVDGSEHLPVFHVVEGQDEPECECGLDDPENKNGARLDLVCSKHDWPWPKHWHVRVVARNGKTLLSSENYTERRGAVEDAHDLADAMGASVVDDATGEDA